MVEAVIERFEARYSLPSDAQAAAARRWRIEGALAAVTDQHLEAALARLGLGDELVVVRDLAAPIRLKRGETAWQAALAWSDAIVSALEARLRDGGGAGVARFRRRGDAVEALVGCALQDDDRLDWAWRELGLLDAGRDAAVSAAERLEAAAAAIAAEPARAAVILRRLAERGWLAALARDLDAWAAADLAAAVAEGAGGGTGDGEALSPEHDDPPAMAGTAIGRAFVAAIRAAPEAARAAWAQLAASILEAPRLAAGRADLGALSRRYLRAAERAAERPSPRSAGSADARNAAASDGLRSRGSGERRGETVRPGAETLPPAQAAAAEDAARGPDGEPDAAWTAFGGLMLLAPVVAESGAGEALFDVEDDDALRARLHALALALGGREMRPGDPAALAFAGLGPLARAPAAVAEPDLIAEAEVAIRDHLRQRLPEWAVGGERDLAARLVDRPARIAVEPGWIEVRFDLDALDPDIRRAGLDLDPDFLPWLGLVLKYRYV